MRLPSASPWLVAVALSLAPSLARAEEPKPAPAPPPAPAVPPAEAASRVRASLPEPSEKAAYAADLDLINGGLKLGEVTMSARVEGEGAQKRWKGTHSHWVGSSKDAADSRLDVVALMERDLRLVRDDRTETERGVKAVTVAERTDKGFRVTFTGGDAAPVESTVEAAADTTSSEGAAMLLFLRQCPAEPAKYEVPVWNGRGRSVEKRGVEVKGAGRMKDEKLGFDVEAWWAVAVSPENTSEVYLDPKDRSILGLRSVTRGFWILKKGLYTPKDAGPPPDITKPATSAKGAGARFAMGILVGDIDNIGASFDWPSFAASIKEQQGMEMDPEFLKSMVLEQIKSGLKSMKPEQAWPVVKSALDAAEETKNDDGSVGVHLGQPFGTVRYTAKEFDGEWRITGMEQPK